MRHHTRYAALVGAMLAVACGGDRAPSDRPRPSPVRPGSYALYICRVVCDAGHPRNVIRSGWVVLDSTPIALGRFPDRIRRALELSFDAGALGDTANGCFVLRIDRPDVPTLAGAMRGGLLTWTPRYQQTDSIDFALYGSADSGYGVTGTATPDGFVAIGRSWGDDMPKAGYPDDIVVGRYLGPPDQARCEDAALAFMAMLRDFRRRVEKARRPGDIRGPCPIGRFVTGSRSRADCSG